MDNIVKVFLCLGLCFVALGEKCDCPRGPRGFRGVRGKPGKDDAPGERVTLEHSALNQVHVQVDSFSTRLSIPAIILCTSIPCHGLTQMSIVRYRTPIWSQ
ncbi:unnamed protein product [Owenia fusiformis]|uniref:Uncharacterized protein n=2 Tax=Owenia fusiformis TaxID=6347 RepID=A0A8J1U5J0_OWEFU|nr:unnamed protein product [Owenia fusiformis]